MANLRDARRKLSLVIIILLCVDLAAALTLIFPIGGSGKARQQQLTILWSELQAKTKETLPLKGIDQKVQQAKGAISEFYKERLPAHYSGISDELGTLASENNVRIATVKYEVEDTEIRDLKRVIIEANLEGDYLQEVKFINALERDKIFFIVDSVTLVEDQGGKVRLQVRLETYLKSA